MRKKFSIVGKPVVRRDGLEKVTGQAKFADDINVPGQLYGVMVRIPVSHAKILSVDYSAVENHPAVAAICHAGDIPGAKKVGPIKQDQPVFCYDKVVTPGDVIAMLVGESEEELLKLRDLVKVEYEPLPVLTDPLKALKSDAPLIHPDQKSNLIVHHRLRKGDVDAGFAESDYILEQTYTTPFIEHAYIEPEAVIAVPREGDKGVHITGSIQNPFTTRKIVAKVLGFPLAKVRIQQAELGGSFGGKDDIMNILSARAALAALKTGRPVKIRYRREDSILESYKRHAYHLHYKVGFNKDGKIKAMKIDVVADGGAYSSMTPFVTWRTVVQATGPYETENVWTDVRGVYTNNPYTGAMRGFGSPQPIFAQESIMDEIAIQLGMTPDEIRRINGFKPGSVTATGHKLENHDVNLLTVLETAVTKTGFSEKWKKNQRRGKMLPDYAALEEISANPGPFILHKDDFLEPDEVYRKGIGLAVSFRGCSLGAEGVDAVAAYLSLQQDGSAYLLSGLAENGQGMRTTYSIVAAEVLGISPDDVFYLDLDTGYVGDSGPTVASRATLMGGGATRAAAEILRSRLENVLRQHWNLPENACFVFRDRQVYAENNPERKIAFAELCDLAYNQAVNLAAIGWYAGPKVHWDETVGQGPAYFTYVYGCQVAEVTVNIATGEVYVDRVVAVHDPGTVINLLGAQGQVYGGVTQGAGYGLWEEISVDKGFIRELNFDQYLIPTSKDIGEIVPIFVEGEDQYGPWGAKSLGEPTLELTAAAIANAVRNATGKRFFHLPLNLEEILLSKKLHPTSKNRGSA
ncbi:MAG: xanthine dehydrogenase family protein [Calditrichaeota bacterium]|nr:xanthine dehydrogenase family protein [Calditrichota bacterium]